MAIIQRCFIAGGKFRLKHIPLSLILRLLIHNDVSLSLSVIVDSFSAR